LIRNLICIKVLRHYFEVIKNEEYYFGLNLFTVSTEGVEYTLTPHS